MEEHLSGETGSLNSSEPFPEIVRSDFGWSEVLPIVPIPVILVLFLVLAILDIRTVFEPPWLLPTSNAVFLLVVPLAVVYNATRGYIQSGFITLLMLGAATLAFGLGAALAGYVIVWGGPNANVTVYNFSALSSGIFHLLAGVLSFIGPGSQMDTQRKKLFATLTYLGIAILLVLMTIATVKGHTPVFFVQGEGPTVWRQTVLTTAMMLFVMSGILFMGFYLFSNAKVLYWYSLALFLIAAGLICVLFQKSVGSPIGWLGRSGQYLGGIYLLVAVVSASKDLHTKGLTVQGGIADLFRHRLAMLVEERTSQLRRANEQLTNEVTERRKIEEELRQSRERLSLALEGANVGTWDWDLTTGKAEWSERNLRRLGYKPNEFEPNLKNWKRLVHPDDWSGVSNGFNDHIQGKSPIFEAEFRMQDKSGGWHWVAARGKVVWFNAKEKPIRMSGVAVDITDRKRAEEALRESEQMLRTILSTSPVGIALTKKRRIEWTNDAWREMFGFDNEQEYLGQDARMLYPSEEDYDRAGKDLYEDLQTGKVGETDTEFIRKDGSFFDAQVRMKALDPLDPTKGTISAVSDISARIRAEEALRESEEKFRHLFNNAEVGMFRTMLDGSKVLDMNEKFLKIFGYPREEMQGKPSLIHWADPREREEMVRRLNTDGSVADFECKMRNVQGEVRTCVTSLRLYRETRILEGSIIDITDRKQAEEALRQSEERYRSLVEKIDLGITLIGPDFSIRMANTTIGKWLDKPVSEITGKQCFREFEKREAVCSHCPGVRTMSTGQPAEVETQGVRDDGTRFDVRIRTFPSWGLDGVATGFIEVVEDITERKRTEEALRESEQQYRTLFEDSIDGVYSVLRDGTITDVNRAFCELFGYTTEEMTGKDIRELYLDPADRPKFQKEIEKHGFVRDYEVKFRKRDGTGVDCLLSASVHFGKDGGIAGYRGIIRDLTAQKALQRQLVQSQKMEAVGTLAGGIAHDFNNLLQVVLGYSELALSDEDLPDHVKNDLGKVLLAGRDGADLAQRLLTFSRKTEPQLLDLDVNQRVRQIRKFLERTIPKMIDIEMVLAQNLAAIHADPSQLDQVLMNLAVNARDAMPDGGHLTIETANVVLDEEYTQTHFGARPGEYVLLRMSDTGHGMDKETLEHIFEPFFTTKEAGKGTGLGLAMVYGIVKQHDGYITCYSEPGMGTTFNIYLPAVIPEARDDQPVITALLQGGTETILLVDDEEFVRDLGRRILERSGYTVLSASDGKEALDLYKREMGEISLVILDLIMPEMGGEQCLEKLLKIDPQVKALIASGFAVNGLTKEAVETGAKGFVSKPYNVKQMLKAVREVLDED